MSERRAISKEAAENINGLWRVDGVPGWVCNGYTLLYMGDEPASAYQTRVEVDGVSQREDTTTAICNALKTLDEDAEATVVAEKRELRIEYVKGDFVKCKDCNGEGETDSTFCDCPHCTGCHECESCNGEGKTGEVREDDGQIVFDGHHGSGDDLQVSGKFAAVFEGSTVKYHAGLEAFLVYDENGHGIAVVMRIRGKAREKSEQAA